MQVFKFGGASVSTVETIRKVAEILAGSASEKTFVVISAMGKTTNALEKVAEAFFAGEKETSLLLFEAIKQNHLNTAKQLIEKGYDQLASSLLDIFTEVEWLLHDRPVRSYDYYYDQIVCAGELMSTRIMSAFFNEIGIPNTWIDVRDILRTDNNFRDATVDWNFTTQAVETLLMPLFSNNTAVVVTQGFIGATADNESTTLGREGSDYSAALFANILDSAHLTIWKDVEGVMNADPRQFPEARLIGELNYNEVVEMAYYGAQVIHPKTIKPLQNKHIPLYVKCFLDRNLPGTIIHDARLDALPPLIVLKQQQVLMHLHTRDFSFASGKPLARLYHLFNDIHIHPNLLQTGAVKIELCLDDKADKIEKLALSASEYFDVELEKDLMLLTIRHYHADLVEQLTAGKRIRLRQQTPETIQFVMHS